MKTAHPPTETALEFKMMMDRLEAVRKRKAKEAEATNDNSQKTYPFWSIDSGKEYVLTVGGDGVVYCNCPSWMYRKLPSGKRTCKHIQAMEKIAFSDPSFKPHKGMHL